MKKYPTPKKINRRSGCIMLIGGEILIWPGAERSQPNADRAYVLREAAEKLETIPAYPASATEYIRHRQQWTATVSEAQRKVANKTPVALLGNGAVELLAGFGRIPRLWQSLYNCTEINVCTDKNEMFFVVKADALDHTNPTAIVVAENGKITEINRSGCSETLRESSPETYVPVTAPLTTSITLQTFKPRRHVPRTFVIVRLCADGRLYALEPIDTHDWDEMYHYKLHAFCLKDGVSCAFTTDLTFAQSVNIEDFDVSASGDRLAMAGIVANDSSLILAKLTQEQDGTVTVTRTNTYLMPTCNVVFSSDGLTVAALVRDGIDTTNLVVMDVDT